MRYPIVLRPRFYKAQFQLPDSGGVNYSQAKTSFSVEADYLFAGLNGQDRSRHSQIQPAEASCSGEALPAPAWRFAETSRRDEAPRPAQLVAKPQAASLFGESVIHSSTGAHKAHGVRIDRRPYGEI